VARRNGSATNPLASRPVAPPASWPKSASPGCGRAAAVAPSKPATLRALPPAVVQRSALPIVEPDLPTVLDVEALTASVMAEYNKFVEAQKNDLNLFYPTGHGGPTANGKVDPKYVAANATVKTVFESLAIAAVKSKNRSKSFSDKDGNGSADIILSLVEGFKNPKMVYHIKLQDAWSM
jgi:hypothetical protein